MYFLSSHKPQKSLQKSVDFQVNTCYALIESLTKKSTETLKHKEVIPIAEEKQRHGNARRVRLQKS